MGNFIFSPISVHQNKKVTSFLKITCLVSVHANIWTDCITMTANKNSWFEHLKMFPQCKLLNVYFDTLTE